MGNVSKTMFHLQDLDIFKNMLLVIATSSFFPSISWHMPKYYFVS